MAKLRKMLGKADSPYILSLMRLIETQSKETLIRWSLTYAEKNFLPIYEEEHPEDSRPKEALESAKLWAEGTIKLPLAKKYILACHEAAREAEPNPIAQAAARAIGQAASTIHAPTHSLGLAFYGAAAMAYKELGLNESAENYDKFAAQECRRMEAALKAIAVPNEPNPAKLNWQCG